MKAPTFAIDITSDVWRTFSDPIGSVLFASCKSVKLIAGQPKIVLNENDIWRPTIEITNIIEFLIFKSCFFNLQQIVAMNCLNTGDNLHNLNILWKKERLFFFHSRYFFLLISLFTYHNSQCLETTEYNWKNSNIFASFHFHFKPNTSKITMLSTFSKALISKYMQ